MLNEKEMANLEMFVVLGVKSLVNAHNDVESLSRLMEEAKRIIDQVKSMNKEMVEADELFQKSRNAENS